MYGFGFHGNELLCDVINNLYRVGQYNFLFFKRNITHGTNEHLLFICYGLRTF